MQLYVEGPGGRGFMPLEGEALQQAREDLWEASPTDFADAYFDYAFCQRLEFINFASRLSALIWLHRVVNKSLDAITEQHSHLERSGEHRVPGWKGESDLVLEEEIYLRKDVSQINSGTIVVACAAALESLATDLLDRDEDRPLHKKGLQQKISALIQRWPHLPQPDEVREDVKWIADRRNAFAHSLLDEVERPDRSRTAWTFDDNAVEEAFERAGATATSLAVAQDQYLSRAAAATVALGPPP